MVIKSQVLAGGRGLGRFTNGLQGGVHIADKKKALELAKQMLGGTLVTKQTGTAVRAREQGGVERNGVERGARSEIPSHRCAVPKWDGLLNRRSLETGRPRMGRNGAVRVPLPKRPH